MQPNFHPKQRYDEVNGMRKFALIQLALLPLTLTSHQLPFCLREKIETR
jgi:hypothetical protein